MATTAIPKVPKQFLGLLGNLPDIDPITLSESFWRLADLYGPIYELDLVKDRQIVLSSYEFAKEVLDDEHYDKALNGPIEEIRALLGDALFTAHTTEPNWGKAHRILMPILGPMGVRNMFDDTLDIASQMILRWDRLGPDHVHSSADQFKKLALDTVALCAVGYRFNHFYIEDMHPFSQRLTDTVMETQKRGVRLELETSLRFFSEAKLQQDIKEQHKFMEEILENRSKHPSTGNRTILDAIIDTPDPETGEKLTHENVKQQMLTLFAAGHETTGGTLSALLYSLLANPDTYHKAQQEVDEVVGQAALTPDHLPKLHYIAACIRETLRLHGPAPEIPRRARTPQILAGKYKIGPDKIIIVNLRGMHRDPAIWGDDCEEFKPERMLDMKQYPPHSWKPFGTGARSCIGRPFAQQEMLMNIALILQRFQVELADPTFRPEIKTAKDMNTDGVEFKVRRRPGRSIFVGLNSQDIAADVKEKSPKASPTQNSTGKPMTILFGSNAGTCSNYAEDLASNAGRFGFQAKVQTLDSAVEALPTNQPVIVISPSYEGKPADNAKKFVSWLEANSSSKEKLAGVKYCIVCVGNSEWSSLFHRVPRLIQKLFDQMGATSIHPAGFIDVKTDMVGPWEDWCDKLWSSIGSGQPVDDDGLEATIGQPEASNVLAGFKTSVAVVKENVVLAEADIGPRKMHMEVELPDGVRYRTGDYLAIVPYNHEKTLDRVLRRFHLTGSESFSVSKTRKSHLKLTHPISTFELLATRVELNTPITQRQLEKLVRHTKNGNEAQSLERMAQHSSETLTRRFSILDVLEDHPNCELDFIGYVDMLKSLSPRQYSISSSPVHPDKVTSSRLTASVTYDVLAEPALSGNDRQFYGVASSFLANSKVGTKINCTVRPTNAGFHLPADPQTPIVLVCAGTGLAPMRGFLQERASIAKANGRQVGPALLYFGCRDFEKDYLYKTELEVWEKLGVVSLRPCFSRRGPPGCYKYTADRIYAERDEIAALYERGAKIFVCGSATKVAKSTADTLIKIWMEENPGKSRDEAQEQLDSIREDQYVSDVFG